MDKPEPAAQTQPDSPRPEPAPSPQSLQRIEQLLGQILSELRRHHDGHAGDFSISKLLSGIFQAVTVAVLAFAYINRGDPGYVTYLLLFAIALQTLTIALLIMGRQK